MRGRPTRSAARGRRREVGLAQWCQLGDRDAVDRMLEDLVALDVRHFRTGLSWADWCTPDGEAWFDWLIGRLSSQVGVLACLHYTPPSLGLEARTSAPPRDPADYERFAALIADRYGSQLEAIELWNEPNNPADWDASLDPDGRLFAAMAAGAARAVRQRGVPVVLGGMCPIDPAWLERMCDYGALADVDAVGVHGFPGTWDFDWSDWPQSIGRIRQVLKSRQLDCEIWITEAGYSTWQDDEHGQVRAFLRARQAPVERLYWTSVVDLDAARAHRDGWHADERHYHLGLRTPDGAHKLLFQLWSRGALAGIHDTGWLETTAPARGSRPVLITGGAGFIGSNLAHRLLSLGQRVTVLDNLSRPGVERNLQWLRQTHGDRLAVEIGDIRDAAVVRRLVRSARQVFHLAAQVAVTTSLEHATVDFDINARGTLNVLEALRGRSDPPPLLFSSTNKVYGALDDLTLRQSGGCYVPSDERLAARGIGEDRPLQFHSPYGCSKGAADQYVLDYAHTFDLPSVVFRMSCIYGPHQFGTEDQGWVAHFVGQALAGEPVMIYGDGMQVRDLLFIDDWVDAAIAAHAHIDETRGQPFNIGGGPDHATSLLRLLDLLSEMHGRSVPVRFEPWRIADQRYYVSDTMRFMAVTGWRPKHAIADGVRELSAWLAREHLDRPIAPAPARTLRMRAS